MFGPILEKSYILELPWKKRYGSNFRLVKVLKLDRLFSCYNWTCQNSRFSLSSSRDIHLYVCLSIYLYVWPPPPPPGMRQQITNTQQCQQQKIFLNQIIIKIIIKKYWLGFLGFLLLSATLERLKGLLYAFCVNKIIDIIVLI